MEINGLPLHVLALHAAVVFGPLAALVAIAYAVLPSWRDRLRWFSGPALEKIETHEEYAETLRLMTSGFAVVTVAATWLHRREGAVRYLLSALVVVGAVLTLIWTILTGDAGAKAVWG